jgi:predicted RNase H-like HicB family nuclease
MPTSAKSKSSPEKKALDRPFDKAIWKKAQALAGAYKIVLEFEDGDWFGSGLELPSAFGDGKTPQSAVADTRQALTLAVAYMLEKGRTPPPPAREGYRSAQVNIRLSPHEKAVLESKAQARGFRGVSDYIRTVVLAES